MVVLYLRCMVEFGVVEGGGGGVWLVFGGKMAVACKNVLFNVLDLVSMESRWMLHCFFVCVGT